MRHDAYLCPGCGRPLASGTPPDDGKSWLKLQFWCTDCGGTATVRYEQPTPRWYALVAAEFDKVSAMPLVLEPDTVDPLWEQAWSSAEATSMEPGEESPEAVMQEAAERTALAIAILAYGPSFIRNRPSKTLAEIEIDRMRKTEFAHYGTRTHHHYMIARFDITDLTDEQRGHLAGEVTVQAEVSDNHPSVPTPELRWEDEQAPVHRKMVDVVKEAYFHDPTVSSEDYGRLMAEADTQDQQNEWEAEVDQADFEPDTEAYRRETGL